MMLSIVLAMNVTELNDGIIVENFIHAIKARKMKKGRYVLYKID